MTVKLRAMNFMMNRLPLVSRAGKPLARWSGILSAVRYALPAPGTGTFRKSGRVDLENILEMVPFSNTDGTLDFAWMAPDRCTRHSRLGVTMAVLSAWASTSAMNGSESQSASVWRMLP